MGTVIPDKLFFKIGEVAQLAGVKTSVLRFWETEFGFLKPDKSNSGQRLYTHKEVSLILEVKRLLYDEKLTIEGVRKRILPNGKIRTVDAALSDKNSDLISLLREVRSELIDLRKQL